MPRRSEPDCYECKHRSSIPGDAHSRCIHPSIVGTGPVSEVFSIFASVGRMTPVINAVAAANLNVSGNPHGVRRGWFNWPYNFDPAWLNSCDGFEKASS